jgi:glycosyltransferase involved in cell wall biosynthesis
MEFGNDVIEEGVIKRKMVVVSIIIPVYNAQQYIKACIDSLLRQTYPYFEIICVDDGSQDQSYEVLKEYAERDDRITVITQENQFAGAARNIGMERAKGKYLLFLDADDFFCGDMLECIVDKAEKECAEIVVFDAYMYDDVSDKVTNASWNVLQKGLFGEGIKSAKELSKVIFNFTVPASWNKLFLKAYVTQNNLRFQNIKRTNDLYFTYSALSCAKRIGILNKKLIYYRRNNMKSLQGSAHETPAVFVQALYALRDFLMDRNLWKMYQSSFSHMAADICISNLGNMKSVDAYKQLCETLKKEIMPNLKLELDKAGEELKSSIYRWEKLMVYGAGKMATTFVNFLLLQCGYKKEKITIAVTDISCAAKQICGIRVQEIDKADKERKGGLVVIAIAEKAIQNEVENNLRDRDYKMISKVGYEEMLDLLQTFER